MSEIYQELPHHGRMGFEGPDESGGCHECGVALDSAEAGELVECSACGYPMCENCPDTCCREGCERAYCGNCSGRWLRSCDGGACVSCVSFWHQTQVGGVLNAMFGEKYGRGKWTKE